MNRHESRKDPCLNQPKKHGQHVGNLALRHPDRIAYRRGGGLLRIFLNDLFQSGARNAVQGILEMAKAHNVSPRSLLIQTGFNAPSVLREKYNLTDEQLISIGFTSQSLRRMARSLQTRRKKD
ncbi:MAG TPA: hypothetical protein HA254_00455 [Candidatus Diapherotrites archaeon]|uniref:Uncharacterized protein n=1 Tax=Candidatus Iainarchaeum sp. TaxID=3101447 RepID=A0A7J4IUE0_9ARCH|nr:hypothetical protein [Candidatus Diapherotrites archaeon]